MNSIYALYRLLRDPLPFLQEMARRGPLNALEIGRFRLVIVNHPELIQQVLVRDAACYTKGRGLQVARRLLGQGLLTSENPLHKDQRRLLQPLFQPRRVQRFESCFQDKTRNLLAHWQGTISANAEMTRLTLAIISETLFGSEVDAEEVRRTVDEASRSFRPMIFPLYERLANWSGRPQRIRRRLDAILQSILDNHRSLLQDAPMAREQLRDEAMTLFLAGHETSAHALTFALYLLSRHPKEQDNPDHEAILLETLRLYPTAWVLGRRSIQETSMGPAGTTVIMSPYVMHRHPDYFSRPEEFRPERWRDKTRPKGVYFPFGAGPRVCIGEHFAWQEMLTALRLVTENFHLRPCSVEKPRLRPGITLAPGQPLMIPVERRSA